MASYFATALDKCSRNIILNEAVIQLRKVKFDTIVCRGRSGLSIAAPLAYLLDKELLIVNKPEVKSHSGGMLAFSPRATLSKAIVVDDFVASGETVKACYEAVETMCEGRVTMLGVYLYKHYAESGMLAVSWRKDPIKLFNRHPKYVNDNYEVVESYFGV